MRRAGYDSGGGVRPSYRSSNASLPTTATPRGRSPSNPSTSTALVNLDVHIQRATIGRDISPADEDLIVLFRRNSKEVTSEPTRWGGDHVAVWNQHVGIQTSLLRSKRVPGDFVRKDYEIVLVALPSHSAVALFTLDFAEVVTLSQGSASHRRSFRISPLKCRDLAATLEFDITWDFVSPSADSPPTSSSVGGVNGSGMLLHGGGALAGLPPASTLLNKKDARGGGAPPLPTPNSSSLSSRRTTTASMSSAGSDLDELHSNHGGGAGSCSSCRSARRRLERKELQVVQLETFLKESQRRIDALGVEADELHVREAAEASNAAKYRALGLRLLQELEVAFQFIASQAQAADAGKQPDAFMFLPQFEFMERVKLFHAQLARVHGAWDPAADDDDDLDDLHDADADADPAAAGTALSRKQPDPVHAAFDFAAELAAAITRNDRLGQQLGFLQRSMGLDSALKPRSDAQRRRDNRPRRSPTDTSDPIDEEGEDEDDADADDVQEPSSVLTMTEQLNNVERENFQLRAQLMDARADLEAFRTLRAGRSNSSLLLSPSESSETATCATDTSTSMIGARSSSGSNRYSNSHVAAGLALDLDRIREDAIGLENDKLALADELAAARRELDELAARLQRADQRADAAEASAAAASQAKAAGDAADGGGFLNKIYMDVGKAKVALEEKVKQLNALLVDATEENARLRIELEKRGGADGTDQQTQQQMKDDEVAELRRAVDAGEDEARTLRYELDAAVRRADEADEALRTARRELADARAALATANDATAQLESDLSALRSGQSLSAAAASPLSSSFRSQSSFASSFATPAASEDAAAAVTDLQKQLKLARQEVMQLRYRSNQLESASEKLEDVSKEKRALQAKLTALEGQLYEQRSRDVQTGGNLEDQLAARDSELRGVRRELEAVRAQLSASAKPAAASTASPMDVKDVEGIALKVAAFERQVEALLGRNAEQARRIEALTTRVAEAADERKELEQVLAELLEEVERVEKTFGDGGEASITGRDLRTSSIPEERVQETQEDEDEDEEQDKPLSWARRGSTPVNSTGRVVDRYASALATSRSASNSTASAQGGGAAVAPARGVRSRQASGSVTSSRIALLMKNFSDGGAADAAGSGASPSLVVKTPVKMDFRSRNGSNASSSSGGGRFIRK